MWRALPPPWRPRARHPRRRARLRRPASSRGQAKRVARERQLAEPRARRRRGQPLRSAIAARPQGGGERPPSPVRRRERAPRRRTCPRQRPHPGTSKNQKKQIGSDVDLFRGDESESGAPSSTAPPPCASHRAPCRDGRVERLSTKIGWPSRAVAGRARCRAVSELRRLAACTPHCDRDGAARGRPACPLVLRGAPRGEREHGLLFVAEAGRGGGARASLKKGPDGRASLPALFAQPRGSGGLPFDLLRLRLTPRLTRLRVLRTPFLPMVLGGVLHGKH